MKQIIFLAMITFSCASVVSKTKQHRVVFEYDKSGNQVVRNLKEITIPNTTDGKPQDEQEVVDLIGEVEVNVYPNPTKGDLYVEIKGGKDDDAYRILTCKMNGEILNTKNQIGNGIIHLDFNSYASGMYILKLISDQNELLYRIIKQ